MTASELTDLKTPRKPSKSGPSNCNCAWVTIPIWTCFPLSWKYLTYCFCSSVPDIVPRAIHKKAPWVLFFLDSIHRCGHGGLSDARGLHEVFTARKPGGPRAQSRAQTLTLILCLFSELCKVGETRAFVSRAFLWGLHIEPMWMCLFSRVFFHFINKRSRLFKFVQNGCCGKDAEGWWEGPPPFTKHGTEGQGDRRTEGSPLGPCGPRRDPSSLPTSPAAFSLGRKNEG